MQAEQIKHRDYGRVHVHLLELEVWAQAVDYPMGLLDYQRDKTILQKRLRSFLVRKDTERTDF